MRINPGEELYWMPLPAPPASGPSRDAHNIGMQNWHRQFQPSFSRDPMTVPEFRMTLSPSHSRNVRGPQASFAPGGKDFVNLFNEAPPRRAFYYDPVFGNPVPAQFPNRWGSNHARRMSRMPTFTQAVFGR